MVDKYISNFDLKLFLSYLFIVPVEISWSIIKFLISILLELKINFAGLKSYVSELKRIANSVSSAFGEKVT